MDWTALMAIIAVNISLIYWIKSDMQAFSTRLETKIDVWRSDIDRESKDFHGRLERQDAEFKGSFEKRDAEFKAHMMYYHHEKK